MLKRLTISFLLLLTLCSCGQQGQVEEPIEPTPEPPIIEEPAYDPNLDYMEHMIKLAVAGEFELLDKAVEERNAMILDLELGDELLTTELFLDEFWIYAGFSLVTDYYEGLITCVATNNPVSGHALTEELARKDAILGIDRPKINFDDLYLLAKIICNEAGSNWLSMEWKMKVGEVFLNRVASPEFPDTFEGVAYQPSQYAGSGTQRFANMVPSEACAEAALRLMFGERLINDPSVIFQANFKQGSAVFEKMHDSKLGNTYLCHSNRMDLYEEKEGLDAVS